MACGHREAQAAEATADEVMTHEERWPVSQGCICPPVTFTSAPSPEDRARCRERSPRLHQLVTEANLKELLNAFHNR